MDAVMLFVFAARLCGIALPLAGYPLLVLLAARMRARPYRLDRTWTPRVTLIVACRNPGVLLQEKIANTFALDYPADRIDMVIVSDGSTDGTEAILHHCEEPRIHACVLGAHHGKAYALNQAMALASGEILVFSDVDAQLVPTALRALLAHFGDETIGGVCGQRVLQREQQALRDAQVRYIDWDSRIKLLETRVGSVTSNDGKLYALRARVAGPIVDGVTDDLYAALQVIAAGWRFVFEPQAVAAVRVPARSAEHEVSRRRRVVCRSLRGLFMHRQLLNPLRFGVFALALAINKVLRRLLPVFLVLLLLSTSLLALESAPWMWLLMLQLGVGGLAVIGAAVPALRGRFGTVSRTAWYFVLGNYGTGLGLWDFVRGRTVVRWDPIKGEVDQSAPAMAYTMSRFPRLTETFILSEIVALLELGYRVRIWPLLRERTRVQHADVERVMPLVEWLPFLSVAVLWSNLSSAISRPGRYWSTFAEMIRGTRPSRNFFIGALGIWPKSVHLARRLEQDQVRHLHAHFASHPALAAWIVYRLTGIGYSFTAHGSDLHVDQTMLEKKIDDARFVVSISEYNRRFIEQRLGRSFKDKIKVVHCGVDTRLFSPNPAGLQTDGGGLRILCVAALRDVKGHRHLIDACALLRDRGVGFRCRLVGDGPLRVQLERQIRTLGLSDQVRLLGPLRQEAVLQQLLQQTDVVALTSVLAPRGNREGIPVTLMEAMSCGLPVVSSRLSGIPELVEDGVSGLLTQPGQPEEIASAFARLAASPALRMALGSAGRERVLRDFDTAMNVRQLAVLFEPYLGQPPEAGVR
jgi:glycosyltransferase involved in cell wall biosynthesis/cellulose synthase/poly-beta-1,6-N-acetylglucosamine synthase-like glycosyltransferase